MLSGATIVNVIILCIKFLLFQWHTSNVSNINDLEVSFTANFKVCHSSLLF